uniref:Zinc finger and AT-hook domain containing n=1 Tax=Astyanax mexicanus TaxID=7994 RepID=W5LEF6_ASTMX
MCKICNLFSPNKSLLLSHVLENHTKEGDDAEEVIIPLKPLQSPQAQPAGSHFFLFVDGVVKRKRGRPKGSTKKVQADKVRTNKASSQPKKEMPAAQPESAAEQQNEDDTGLECKKCHRKFSNKRQISKHICFAGLKEAADEEENHGHNPDAGKKDDGEDDVRSTPKKARTMRTDKASNVKDPESTNCTKNPIVSVVLAAHEAIPGATKIVPIEAAPAEAVIPPETTASSQVPEPKKGYQEYAIQQAAYEVPLKSNRLGQTQLKIFTCEYCNKVFKFKHSLQAHLRIHTNEKPFKCPQCDYASTIKANLSVHMRKHTGEKFSCEHCSFSCLSKGHLKVHVERVHKKVKQYCRFCKKKYSDVKNLLKHIRESHDLEDEKVKESYDEYRLQTREGKRQLLYDCQICDRKFKNELDRDRHLMVHGSKRPFGCELCDHGSTKFQALQAHIRKHPFVYVCAICLQRFVSSVRLKSHFQQSHPEVDETTAFSDSIKNSFCLLKPGDDIQQDIVKQEELDITKELSLLNVQEVLITDVEEEQEDDAECPEGLPTEIAADTLEQETQEDVASTDIDTSCQIIETVETQTHENQPQGSLPNMDSSVTPGFDNPNEDAENVALTSHTPITETQTTSTQQMLSTDSGDAPVAQNEIEETHVTPSNTASSGAEDLLATTHQEEKSAFMQILDQMQKRQLNMDIFERIRKIYGDLECEYCGKLFWYQVHYNMHVRTHTREHLHYCSQCSYSSITKNCLKRHVIQKHSNILLKCPLEGCEYCTPDKYKLQSHVKTHTETVKNQFICPVCKDSFPEDKLRYHIKINHPDTSWSTISEALGIRVHVKGVIGKRASKCPYCDCFFTRNGTDMQQHIWAHEGVKPFKCPICDYASRSKSNLKAHMNRHNTEKTHLCDLCGKKFKSKCTLKSHKLMHSADGKQFKCTECDFTAAQKPHLLRHMEQHASFKPFRCAHCHYSCNIPGPGTASSETVMEQGGVKCPVCNYVYGTKWEMNRHLKSKHGLKVVENSSLGLNQWEVTEEEDQAGHAMMIQDAMQQASVGLGEEHHLVVSSDDVEGIKTVTVYTQGDDASQFIVYVQEAVQTEETTTEVV